MRPLLLVSAALGLAAAVAPAPAEAAKPAVHTGLIGNVAVSGYDPVAYFREGRAMPGRRDISATHRGATYRFASTANRDTFLSQPDRFVPQYGGYCAWAVSQGYTASADPRVWRIVNGKLYLNYNAEVGRRWAEDIPGHIAKANANWPKVLG